MHSLCEDLLKPICPTKTALDTLKDKWFKREKLSNTPKSKYVSAPLILLVPKKNLSTKKAEGSDSKAVKQVLEILIISAK